MFHNLDQKNISKFHAVWCHYLFPSCAYKIKEIWYFTIIQIIKKVFYLHMCSLLGINFSQNPLHMLFLLYILNTNTWWTHYGIFKKILSSAQIERDVLLKRNRHICVCKDEVIKAARNSWILFPFMYHICAYVYIWGWIIASQK